MNSRAYRAIISSDWSECLSPNGPFDPISFLYPDLKPELQRIFRSYTGNVISLDAAVHRITGLLPAPLTKEQMDEYLDAGFQTYTGVPELIQWCLERDILFMINTTGTHGYFQRAVAKGLLPPIPVVSANPLTLFERTGSQYLVSDIEDKPRNTEAAMYSRNLSAEKLVVMGDSGGDGPHFHWAAQVGGYLIGSMTKHSLVTYCQNRGVAINTFFGLRYGQGEARDVAAEMQVDFMDLTEVIVEVLQVPH
jgi:2-hydroxy-3-keto-5-methylthiopentenyl-1-phosphate phosphatase